MMQCPMCENPYPYMSSECQTEGHTFSDGFMLIDPLINQRQSAMKEENSLPYKINISSGEDCFVYY